MNRREMLMHTGAAMLGLGAALQARAAGGPRRILYFTKSAGFQHSVVTRQNGELAHSERILVEMGRQYNVEVVASKDGGLFTAETLKTFDALVFYTTGDLTETGTDGQPPMPAGGKELLIRTVEAGLPLIGIHTATDTFHSRGDEVDPYIQLIGGEFRTHGAQQKATQDVLGHDLPGWESLPNSFELHEEWYAFRNLNPDMRVLLRQQTRGMTGDMYEGQPAYPSTWIRTQGRGRIAYTSMGHREDVWTNPVFHGILLGLFAWALGEVETTTTPNGKTVTPELFPA